MNVITKKIPRTMILIICLYFFNYLNIFNMDLTVDWYSHSVVNSVDYYLQGSELAFIGIVYFIIGLIFFHTLFFSMIKGKDFFFNLLDRSITLKLFDYIWYFGSFISVMMILIGINAENSKIYLKNVTETKKQTVKSIEKKVANSKYVCSQIELIDYNLEKVFDEDEKKEIIAFTSMCKLANEDNINYVELKNQCIIEKYHISSSGQEEPLYFKNKNINEAQTDSLNYMVNLCDYFYELESINKDIENHKRASLKHISTELKKVPEWYILLVLIISFRIVKTTIEVAEVVRNKKKGFTF